jgi:glutathione peroxidase
MIRLTLFLMMTWVGCKQSSIPIVKNDMTKSTIYQFTLNDALGQPIDLSAYQGKVVLIVNTASECGFTPQYRELEELYKTYKEKGFELLAFPSNDFGGQEPLNGEEIVQFCSMKFRTTFPVFEKVKVKGKQATPLYQFLGDKSLNGRVGMPPKWNFHKYLINRNGQVVDYYLSFTKPTSSKIKNAIEKCLREELPANAIIAQ